MRFPKNLLTICAIYIPTVVCGQFDGFNDLGKTKREIKNMLDEPSSVWAIKEDVHDQTGAADIAISLKKIPQATGIIRFAEKEDRCVSIALVFPIVEGIIEIMKKDLDTKYKRTAKYLDNLTWEVRPNTTCTLYQDDDLKSKGYYAILILPKDVTNTVATDQKPDIESTHTFSKDREKSKSETANQPWFRNSLLGVSFETPEKLVEQSAKPPAGYEELISIFKTYFSKEDDLVVFFMYAESKFETYDKRTGLNSSIGNMVNTMNGTDLVLDFFEPENSYDDLRCSGSFKLQGNEIEVKGYVYWNGRGKFFLLTTMGEKKDSKSMDRIIESLIINIP